MKGITMNTPKKKRVPHGVVLAEYRKHAELILRLLLEGYSINCIHQILQKEHNVLMCYDSLCRMVKKHNLPKNF